MSNENKESSWLGPLPDEYAPEKEMTGRRMLVAALTVIILAIFGGLIWYSYMQGQNDGPVPVVRADKAVVKVKPDTPGGLQVPDQDKRVFDRMASDPPKIDDKLSPGTELPVDLPTANKKGDIETIEKAKQKAVLAEQNAKDAPMPPNEVNLDPPSEEVAKQVAAIAPSVSGKSGNFLIQLGAFGQESSAEKLWAKLQEGNPGLLAAKNSDIMMVDLGKKGVLYRLRGGMFRDRAAADKACTALKAKKQPCIVVTK